jgi:hypothetical protein
MGPLHGYGIARRIEQVSEDALKLNEGTVYASLMRLLQRRWISASWGTSENNRKGALLLDHQRRPPPVDRGDGKLGAGRRHHGPADAAARAALTYSMGWLEQPAADARHAVRLLAHSDRRRPRRDVLNSTGDCHKMTVGGV